MVCVQCMHALQSTFLHNFFSNSLLCYARFFCRYVYDSSKQTNVQHSHCLYGCVLWRSHQPDYRIIKYGCFFDSLLSARWRKIRFFHTARFFSLCHFSSTLVHWYLCVCLAFSFVLVLNLFDAGVSSMNIYFWVVEHTNNEIENTNTICRIKRMYSQFNQI